MGGGCTKGPGVAGPKLNPHLNMDTVPTHTAFLPIASVMSQTHSSLKRGFRDMQGHPYHLHLPGNSMSPTAPSAPAQGTTAHPPAQSNAVFLLSFFLAPRDSPSPSMAFAS